MSRKFTFGGSYASIDADALAFLTATGITDATIRSAINTLVVDMKGYGIWTKMKAIYPFVGGTATTHKFNLKNPLDTDAAFRLVFNGGWAHSATGSLPNGTNAFADTFFNASTSFNSQNDSHISYYSRTASNGTTNVEMGIDNGQNKGIFITPRFGGASSAYRAVNSSLFGPGTSPIMTGLFTASRIASTSMKLYKNNTILFNDSVSSVGLQNISIVIGAYREVNGGGSPRYFTNRECAFSTIGDGLSDTDNSNLYNAVQAFQTTLSRQV